MPSYRLAKTAEADLIEIVRYGDEYYGIERSNQYRDQLKAHFELLAANAELFQAVDHIRPRYRRSVCGVHAIYYRIVEEGIEIMALMRGQNSETYLLDA